MGYYNNMKRPMKSVRIVLRELGHRTTPLKKRVASKLTYTTPMQTVSELSQ